MGGRGERVSGISSGSVMAQCRVIGRGVRGVRAGFPPGAEMSEVTWRRFVGEKGQEEGVRRREEERKALGIYCREWLQGNFWGSSRDRRKEASRAALPTPTLSASGQIHAFLRPSFGPQSQKPLVFLLRPRARPSVPSS